MEATLQAHVQYPTVAACLCVCVCVQLIGFRIYGV